MITAFDSWAVTIYITLFPFFDTGHLELLNSCSISAGFILYNFLTFNFFRSESEPSYSDISL